MLYKLCILDLIICKKHIPQHLHYKRFLGVFDIQWMFKNYRYRLQIIVKLTYSFARRFNILPETRKFDLAQNI